MFPELAGDLRTSTSAAQLTMTTCLLGLAFGLDRLEEFFNGSL